MKKLIALLAAALLAVSAFGILTGCSTWQEPGKVYYLNCVPEANEAWQKLASAYSDIYGVEVTVRTVTTDDCTATLKSALSGENAPTLFQFHDAGEVEALKGSCLDLTGTAVLGQMITGNFNLTDGGAVKAIGYSYDAFGIMVNTALLAAAGYEVADISDFAALKAVAEDIHSRTEELGFDAFATGTDEPAIWQLAEAARFYQSREQDDGVYLTQYRQVLDLYIHNSSQPEEEFSNATDSDLAQFAAGKAVFCQNSASVYGTLVGETYKMDPGNLAMIPIYCGAEGEQNAALCCTTRSYWAVNSGASEADRKATLDFLNWVVTSEYGISVLEDQFGGVPFKAATGNKNVFYGDSNALLTKGNYAVIGYDSSDDSKLEAVAAALAVYAADQSDNNWEEVKNAFGESQNKT